MKRSYELFECIKLLNKHQFKGSYGIMMEIPSTLYYLDEFIKLGVKNITIGINDLTTFILGTRRGVEFHDPNHKAVIHFIEVVKNRLIPEKIQLVFAGYYQKNFVEKMQKLSVENLIVHYSELNNILNIPVHNLPYINRLKEIKLLTKRRIADFS